MEFFEFFVNNYEVLRYLLFVLGILFLGISLIRFLDFEGEQKGCILFGILAALCGISIYLTRIIEENEEKVETRLVLEENYKDYVPMDNNTFYWNDKVYEYELSKNKTELIVKCRENGTENATAYDLEEVK